MPNTFPAQIPYKITQSRKAFLVGFAAILGIGALLMAGVLALAQRLKMLAAAAFSWAVL